MVGRPDDCLTNPLGAVRFTFEKAVASGSHPASFDGKDWGASELFHEFLFDNGGLSQNEETWHTNKCADVSQFHVGDSPDMRVWERRLLYRVPVPGQNAWLDNTSEAVVNPCINFTSPNRAKRQWESSSVSDDVDMQDTSNEFQSSPRAKKMRGECPPSENMIKGTDSGMIMLPDFNRNNLPCMVKIYDSPESALKLNDVYEFIGVLAYDSEDKDDKGATASLSCSQEAFS